MNLELICHELVCHSRKKLKCSYDRFEFYYIAILFIIKLTSPLWCDMGFTSPCDATWTNTTWTLDIIVENWISSKWYGDVSNLKQFYIEVLFIVVVNLIRTSPCDVSLTSPYDVNLVNLDLDIIVENWMSIKWYGNVSKILHWCIVYCCC